jgi:hypothetical protein
MARVGLWRWCLIWAFAFAWTAAAAEAQVALPGRNVNMAAGTTLPDGDPFLQRQNELTIACSSRDPRTCLAASNDYRTVDVPGLSGGRVVGDAGLGTYVTTNGGQTWRTTLVPGYPQDPSNASPLKGLEAAADPTLRSGTNGIRAPRGRSRDAAGCAEARRSVDDSLHAGAGVSGCGPVGRGFGGFRAVLEAAGRGHVALFRRHADVPLPRRAAILACACAGGRWAHRTGNTKL